MGGRTERKRNPTKPQRGQLCTAPPLTWKMVLSSARESDSQHTRRVGLARVNFSALTPFQVVLAFARTLLVSVERVRFDSEI